MIFAWEIPARERHRDWLLKLASVAEPATAELYRKEAREISRAIKEAKRNVHA